MAFVILAAAYRVTVTSSAAEGDFMTYKATVDEVIKSTNKGEQRRAEDPNGPLPGFDLYLSAVSSSFALKILSYE